MAITPNPLLFEVLWISKSHFFGNLGSDPKEAGYTDTLVDFISPPIKNEIYKAFMKLIQQLFYKRKFGCLGASFQELFDSHKRADSVVGFAYNL